MSRKPTYSMKDCEAVARQLGDHLATLWDMPLLRHDAECDRLLNRMPACANMEELSADLDLLHLRVRTMLAVAAHREGSSADNPPLSAAAPVIGASQPRGRRTFLKL